MDGDATDLVPIFRAISACGLDVERWPQALELIIDYLGGNGATLFSIEATPEAKGLWANARLDPESVREYVRYYRDIDPWTRATYARGLIVAGAVYTGDMLMPTERLRETEYYRDFLLRFDNVDLLCAMLHDGSQPPVPTVALSVYRGIGDPPFAAGDIARMQPLDSASTARHRGELPADRPRPATGGAGPCAGCAGPAAAAAEPGRRGGAGQLRGGGPARRGRRADSSTTGRLRAADRGSQRRLAELIAGGGAEPEGVVRIPRPSGKPPYLLLRVPVPEDRTGVRDVRRPCSALVLHDPTAGSSCNTVVLRQLYGLTPAELKVAEGLLDIGSPAEIAARLGRSENTVRTQIKAVFGKTGTRRQAELVKLLLSLPGSG